MIEPTERYLQEVSSRLNDRRKLLNTLDARRALRDLEGATRAVDDFYQQAFEHV